MLPPHNSKIALYLIMQSEMLGVVRADGIYRFFCFDDLMVDKLSAQIQDKHWVLDLEEFVDAARCFNHQRSGETFLEFYPRVQTQQMLELAWNDGDKLTPLMLAEMLKVFRPVQYGRLEKD